MNLTKLLVCSFEEGHRGKLCRKPDGEFKLAYVDRDNIIEVSLFEPYLCEVVKVLDSGVCFVRVVKSAKDVFIADLQDALCAAEWRRDDHLTDDVVAEVMTESYGRVVASWYESTGRFQRRTLTIGFGTISFSIVNGVVNVDKLAAHIRKCVGPTINLAAAIARQNEYRHARR
jgi:hypothetical protein